MGLLRPVDRTEGGFRLFCDGAAERVRWIENLQAVGMSLSEIREIDREFDRRWLGPQAAALVRKRFKEKLERTRQEIERLAALASELEKALDYLETCKQCIPPLPRAACRECEMPRTDPVKPAILEGFYTYTDTRVGPPGRLGEGET
jgi:DNA-binding transcriptional MerR regulator